MKVRPVKTQKITPGNDLYGVLNDSIARLPENSVLAITSKIISLCENNVVKIGSIDKDDLIHDQADFYLPVDKAYNINLTIKNNILIPSAGIDESNGNGYYILWPEDPQKSANEIKEYLTKKFKLNNLGIIIVDSKTTPLRWGVIGTALAHSGFTALIDYTGKLDIFGRKFKFEKANIADSLAVAAVAVMGEGSEQTPIALIEDIPFVEFQSGNPTDAELENLKIDMKNDLYKELLTSVKWKRGKGGGK